MIGLLMVKQGGFMLGSYIQE